LARGYPIDDLGRAGWLSKPSVIRPTKLTTIETIAATALGQVTPDVAARVRVALRGLTPLDGNHDD
jgi:hypothetical protein